MNASPTDFGRK